MKNPMHFLFKVALLALLSFGLSQLSRAEKALKIDGYSIPFTFDNYDDFNELGETNQVHAFWFKRDVGEDYLFLYEPGYPFGIFAVNSTDEFEYGGVGTGKIIDDTNWHHVMMVLNVTAQTENRLQDTHWRQQSSTVNLEIYVDNELVHSEANISLGNRYAFRDPSLSNNGATFPPALANYSFTLGGFHGVLDDYIVANDLTDDEILDLYERGASTIDSDDERVKLYWADESTFQDIGRFSDSSVAIEDAIIDSDRPTLVHLVSVQSDYGEDQYYIEVRDPGTFALIEKIEGPIQFARIGIGNIANIFAPEYVYLDRYGNELEPTANNIRDFSYYRRVNTGYSAPGATIDGTSPIEVKLTVDKDISIGWSWRDEVAVFLESATEDYEGLGQGDGGLSVNGVDAVPGKIWVTPGSTEVTAEIAKSIVPGSEISVGAESTPVRFSITAISEENSTNHTNDHFLAFDGTDDRVTYNDVTVPNSSSLSFEFWARRDNIDTSANQELVRITDGVEVLRIGFLSSPGYESGGMFLANADSGGVLASIDGAFIDDYWHHWVWSYDGDTQTMTIFRDGDIIATAESVNLGLDFDQEISAEYFKGGGIQPSLSTNGQSGSNVYEASGDGNGDLAVVGNGGSFNGNFYAYLDNNDEYVEWTIPNTSAQPFQRWLQIRYRGQDTNPGGILGTSYENQNIEVTLNGQVVIEHNGMDGNNSWRARQALVTLQPGSNVIRATAGSISSDEEVEVDEIRIYNGSSPSSAAAALSEWDPAASSGVASDFDISSADQLDYYGFSWEGKLWVDESRSHEFESTSDDGSRIYLNGSSVLNNDGIQGDVTETGTANLTAGFYDFDLEYYYIGGGAVLTASWDGETPLNESVYLPNSTVTLGGHNSGNAFQGELNNVRIWGKALTEAEAEVARFTSEFGSSGEGLIFEETFEAQSLTSLTSSEGCNYTGALSGFDTNFSTEIETDADKIGVLFPSFDFTEDFDAGNRASTQTVVANDWLRLGFIWKREYLVELKVNDAAFIGQPFMTVEGTTYQGAEAASVWVEEFSEVTVGAKYRTDDRCFTLTRILAQLYVLQGVTMANVTDGTLDGAATRQFTIPELSGPGGLTFGFEDTIFHAELPLGTGLDVSTLANLNIQLVPDLCEGGELRTTEEDPQVVNLNPSQAGGVGNPVQWDPVGKKLWPVHPGVYRVQWPDANDPDITYLIEFVAGFPTETEEIAWQREDDSGYREGSYPTYVTEVTLPETSDEFPASPTANYQVVFSSDRARTPPIELDPNVADRWGFVSQPFTNSGSTVDEASNTFKASQEGQAVLLFNYRPTATEVANGNAAKEAYVVRVVETKALADQVQDNDQLSGGTHGVLTFSGAEGETFTVDPSIEGGNFTELGRSTLEAWVKLDPAALESVNDMALFRQQFGSNQYFYIGVQTSDHPQHPLAMFVELASGGSLVRHAVTEDLVLDDGWHHWAITHDHVGNTLSIYVDGVLVQQVVSAFTSAAEWSEMLVGDTGDDYAPLPAQVDNLRVWEPGLSATEVREAMRSLSTSFGSQSTTEFYFDAVSGLNVTNNVPASELGILSSSDLVVTTQADLPAEVATRVTSKLDTAGFDSGFILNEVSNYNPSIYKRNANNGTWGGIYPVNWSGLYDQEEVDALEVTYFENPFSLSSSDPDATHPNVAWPYVGVRYDDVNFPTIGEHKDKRLFIASRLGTEGVDASGADQLVYDPNLYANLSIYNQPDPTATGYNPNEEHALVVPSIKDQLTGDNSFNLAQDAAFALQDGLNITDEASPTTYTSEPWVLVQYGDIEAGEVKMAAYKVEETRSGSALFPALDATTHQPIDSFGQPVVQPADPTYEFDYPSFAGDVVIPPYPLNLVVGAVILGENSDLASGGNFGIQRTLWNDKNGNSWVVSGEGSYFKKWWYPFRNDFWYDLDKNGVNDITSGTSVAWVPSNDIAIKGGTDPEAQVVRYDSYWRDNYPVLKRGETVTYAGGEYAAENTDAEGLPAVLAWASGEVIFDSAWPVMVFDDETAGMNNLLEEFSARLIRPLDRHEVEFNQSGFSDDYTPANTDNIFVDGPRWYFKNLVGSLQKRFYYDSLGGNLVFRGRVNDLEGGDPDLTQNPVALSILEPNVMTQAEYEAIIALDSSNGDFTSAVDEIYLSTQDPHGTGLSTSTTEQKFFAGVEPKTTAVAVQPDYYSYSSVSDDVMVSDVAGLLGLFGVEDKFQHFNSLGTGAALVPNPRFLTEDVDQDYYITLVENNHPDVSGAVSLHIIHIAPERFRGAIKVVEAADAFDEKINLQHSGEFGANTEGLYYQWWVREVDNLENVGIPGEDLGWQIYTQGLGLHSIEFAGRPDVVLSDKLFFVRYGEENELNDVTGITNSITDDPDTASADDASWRLVDFEDDTWLRSGSADTTNATGGTVPFQWAGASNSPQAQADGSKKYIPQLVMGWVKRVLDRINPYEARYTDFYNNESPATYSSMLQVAGAPFRGKVALNATKDVVENVGLIELYETVLARAKELTLDIPGASTAGTNQALLLAATRLAFLYEIFAKEAYSDAQDPTVTVTTENGLTNVSTYIHAFMNQEASLLHEELALLRGSDFLKAYPAYNRLFWNYVKGEGEAAYNANYNVTDENLDGFINEFDAARLYPQGHGDAWGHFLSSNKMHYELLQSNAFDWEARAELYSLLDNVIEADFLDEKSFSRIAAAKARAGNEIVRATYREAYVEDPDGQWQGYTDGANPARAWGVSEWSKRAGQGAYFDWLVGNNIQPEVAEDEENLHRIDRIANASELGEVAGTLFTIQQTLDEANSGFNPLGLDADTVTFDLDPILYDGDGGARKTHFEQVYDKAVAAAKNAKTALDYASRIETNVRRIADDTEAIRVEAVKQDLDFRNRLIEIFGTPYSAKIGPGQPYDEGYAGPDTLLYQYIDRTSIDDYLPSQDSRFTTLENTTFSDWASDYSSLDWNPNYASIGDNVSTLFDRYYLTEDFSEVTLGTTASSGSNTERLAVTAPVEQTSSYAFQVPSDEDWGSRTSYGKLQVQLNEMVLEHIALQESISEYQAYIESVQILSKRLKQELRAHEKREESRSTVAELEIGLSLAHAVANAASYLFQWQWDFAWQSSHVVQAFFPKVVGFSNDATSVVRGGSRLAGLSLRGGFGTAWTLSLVAEKALEASLAYVDAAAEHDEIIINEFREINAITQEMGSMMLEDEGKRLKIAQHIKRLENLSHKYQTTLAEGFRLLDEREGFNIALAGKVQRNRYSDMIFRVSRNDALTKYQDTFQQAQEYAWLAAKAYDYETSLSADDPFAATTTLEELVKVRSLGLWNGDEPAVGQGGIAEALAELRGNFEVLEGQLGVNNPQVETGKLSLRHEHFRILRTNDTRWQSTLTGNIKNLWDIPEYRSHCRPFANEEDGDQPGLVIPFDTHIESGFNVFGEVLGGEDHAYSSANFATKIRSAGIFFEGYNDSGLSTSPRVYLVPVGADTLQISNGDSIEKRSWNVIEQRIPAPFVINDSHLNSGNFIPSINSLGGSFAEVRRFGDFRAYHDSGTESVDTAQLASDSRLIGRSVANTKWLLIIPGATLHSNAGYGLEKFVETVSDIKLVFETYSHAGN